MRTLATPALQRPRDQGGSALIIVLVLMVVLLVLSVSTSRSNVFLERASSNSREMDLAFQAAETALRAGEAAAASLAGPSDGDANCSVNGVCYLGNNNYRLTLGAWNGKSVMEAAKAPNSILDAEPAKTLAANTIDGVSRQPSYLIEILPSARAGEDGSSIIYLYRVTAKGWGKGANSSVVVQSVFAPPSA